MPKERLTHDKIINNVFGSTYIPEVHPWDRSWSDFSKEEQKTILEKSAKQGAEDQDKLNKLYAKHKTKL